MQLTPQAIQRFRDQIAKNGGLSDGDVCRVDGMGETYVALAETEVGEEYRRMYKIDIDKVTYHVYNRVPPS